MKHVLSVLVENKSGVLSRVVALIARRGFNIDSLSVGPTEDPTRSRITIIVDAEKVAYDQITKQLNKLVCVYKIQDLTNDGKNVYAAFYVVDGNPPMVVFDSDLNVVRKGWFDASQGFDVAPARFGGGKQAFVWSKTGKRGDKCATCTVRLWIPQRGDFL